MTDIRKNVLIISGEEQILKFLENIFSGNFIVGKASDVVAGLNVSRREKPAAVVLDVDVAGIDIVKHIRQLKDSGAETMVWALCSRDNFDAAKKSLLGGAVGYVLKPYAAKDWEKVVSCITTGIVPVMKEHPQVAVAQVGTAPDEKVWEATKTVRVLGGIVAGVGYVSLPLYLLTLVNFYSCVGVSSAYCVKNGTLACGMAQASFAYFLLAGPFILPACIAAVVVNIITFLKKKRLTLIDLVVLAMGVGTGVIILLFPTAPLGCGIM